MGTLPAQTMQPKSADWHFVSSTDEARVNITRAVIHAFGFSPEEGTTPVHVSRLSALFRRYYPNDSVVDALQMLLLLKEAIELPQGFWLPSACRSIVIDNVGRLLIAPHPTDELQRGIGAPIQRLRYGRICDDNAAITCESESLDSWAEAVDSLEDWTRQALRHCDAQLVETVDTRRSIEIYKTWSDREGSPSSSRSWCKYPSEEDVPDGKFLCREMTPQGQSRRFLGEFRRGRISRECDLTIDHIRFRFGLDLLSNRKMELRTSNRRGKITFELRRYLPLSEKRIVVALMSDVEATEFGVIVSFEMKIYPVIKQALSGLGMTFRERADG